ncbi:MAG: alpha/beta fold hydrolase [Actinomycetota bacterium]
MSAKSGSSGSSVGGLEYVRTGSGPPLVLLHGIGGRRQVWEPVMDQLSAQYDVIALDLPGFGKSLTSPPPAEGAPAGVAALASHVTEFLASQGIERPHAAGNSLGGALALELASAGAAASATALSPAGFATAADRRRAVVLLTGIRGSTFLPRAVLRVALRSRPVRALGFGLVVAHPDRLSTERAVGDALAMRRGRGFRPVARALRDYEFAGEPAVPVTIAWAGEDRILPPRQAERAKARLPHARHIQLPGCGHVPMSDDPDAVASVISSTVAEAVR